MKDTRYQNTPRLPQWQRPPAGIHGERVMLFGKKGSSILHHQPRPLIKWVSRTMGVWPGHRSAHRRSGRIRRWRRLHPSPAFVVVATYIVPAAATRCGCATTLRASAPPYLASARLTLTPAEPSSKILSLDSKTPCSAGRATPGAATEPVRQYCLEDRPLQHRTLRLPRNATHRLPSQGRRVVSVRWFLRSRCAPSPPTSPMTSADSRSPAR